MQQPSGLEILGCWAGHTGAMWNMAGATADSPLLELSTNLREDSVAGEVAALNKEKALIGAFSGHWGQINSIATVT